MSYYAGIPLDRLRTAYEDLLDFAHSGSRARDRASARVALAPIVEELKARGEDAEIPEWTQADIEKYKQEMEEVTDTRQEIT